MELFPGMDGKILDMPRGQSCPGGHYFSGQGGSADLGIYQGGAKAADAGAICGLSLSKEMLAVRLTWALGQTRDLDGI